MPTHEDYIMFIPKSKMPGLLKALQFAIDCAEDKFDPPVETDLESNELELVKQLHDRAALCQHGDGTGLDIDVRYAPGPSAIIRGLCGNCGSKLINGTCFSC
jgi:hypothetical protein